jgi:hypothetical protein
VMSRKNWKEPRGQISCRVLLILRALTVEVKVILLVPYTR